jgi:hypothetical protein
MSVFGAYPRGDDEQGSHCGINSGIEIDSLIVFMNVECQAKRQVSGSKLGVLRTTTA